MKYVLQVKYYLILFAFFVVSNFGYAQKSDSLNIDIGEVTYKDSSISENIHAFIIYSYSINKKGLPSDLRFEKEECPACNEAKIEEIRQMIRESLNRMPKLTGSQKRASKRLRFKAGYKYNLIKK